MSEGIFDKLTERFTKLRTTRGMCHDFLGMQLDFLERGVLRLSMIKYLEESLKDFPEEIDLVTVTPASNKLFEIKEAENLNEEGMKFFHGIVAKLLYIICPARLDLVTTIIFMTTRVSKSAVDDWHKLCWLL